MLRAGNYGYDANYNAADAPRSVREDRWKYVRRFVGIGFRDQFRAVHPCEMRHSRITRDDGYGTHVRCPRTRCRIFLNGGVETPVIPELRVAEIEEQTELLRASHERASADLDYVSLWIEL